MAVGLAMGGCDSSEFNDDELDFPTQPGWQRVSVSAVEYNPAPGQFVNEIPLYETGDTPVSINAKALEAVNRGSLVSLGAFGGEIVMTLATPIVHNPSNASDFRIPGNSYITGTTGNTVYGSSEPGMVWVMKDENGNGKPDDKWYAFVGDMGDRLSYVTVTYTPAENPTSAHWVDWTCTTASAEKSQGVLTCNPEYHNHTYFPMWRYADVETAKFTVSGYALPPNGFLEESSGLYRQICYQGFADSFPNNDARSEFSLRDAIDINTGKKADIDRVDFIKITTAVLDSNGPLGEASTEVGGVEVFK